MDEIFNILSSSARIDKSKRKKKKKADDDGHENGHGSTSAGTISNNNINNNNNTNGDQKTMTTIAAIPTVPQTDHTNTNNKKNHSPSKLRQIHHEEIAAFRNKLGIHLSQSNRHDMTIPDPISAFSELKQPQWWTNNYNNSNNSNNKSDNGNDDQNKKMNKKQQTKSENDYTFTSVKNTIIRNIEQGRWINPTPIQMQSITAMVGRRDVLGCAPTGSGKSGAFIIPTLLLSSVSDEIYYGYTNNDNGHDCDNDNDDDDEAKSTKKNKKKKKKNKGGGNPKDQTNNSNGNRNSNNSSSSSSGKIRALLLAPSRELASQLHREVERLGEGKLHGIRCALLSKSNANTICSTYGTTANSSNNSAGAGNNRKNNPNQRGLDVLVSTPLRLLDCIERHSLDLGSVRVVVLDEADRLLDGNDGSENAATTKSNNNDNNDGANAASDHKSGSSHVKTFLSQIDTILSVIPNTAVRALFSATIGSSVRHLAESILRSEVDISIGGKRMLGNSTASGVSHDITQKLTFVGREEGKLLAIRQIIAKGLSPPVIIFLQSKDRAQALFLELMYDNANVDVIHAGKSQAARDAAVAKFRKGETWILICTDLCARGLDFKAVNMVINYDLPTSGVTYVHRIGRCGRAGRKGEAITLFTEADFDHLRNIANVMKLSGCDVPDWMLSLKKNSKGGGTGGKRIPMKRKTIDTSSGYDKKKLHKKKQIIENSKRKKDQG